MNILAKLLTAALISIVGFITPKEAEIKKDRFEKHNSVEISNCNEIEANACFLLNTKSPI